jgi:hypothetical protein
MGVNLPGCLHDKIPKFQSQHELAHFDGIAENYLQLKECRNQLWGSHSCSLPWHSCSHYRHHHDAQKTGTGIVGWNDPNPSDWLFDRNGRAGTTLIGPLPLEFFTQIPSWSGLFGEW